MRHRAREDELGHGLCANCERVENPFGRDRQLVDASADRARDRVSDGRRDPHVAELADRLCPVRFVAAKPGTSTVRSGGMSAIVGGL